MNISAYLDRINYTGSINPTLETLKNLHRLHLLAVPFENLNIHLGIPIITEESSLFNKIVAQRRGGFCYELNGLFAALLKTLGYQVKLISARVSLADGNYGPPFDHLALLVQCEQLEQSYLADVGFGDSFREPLQLTPLREQPEQLGQSYRLELETDGENWVLQQKDEKTGGEWKNQYSFTLLEYSIEDFGPMCLYHQTSPASGFTQRRICSIATPEGRVSLAQANLIVTHKGTRQENPVSSPTAYLDSLQHYFGIRLDAYQAQIEAWNIFTNLEQPDKPQPELAS